MIRKLIAESLGRCRNGHVHAWSNLMSRRQFARTATGIAAVGAAFGLGIPKAAASAPDDPLPIPGVNRRGFHVFGPGANPLIPIDAEPATITNLNGFVGLAYIDGTVQRTDRKTGQTVTLPM